MEFDAFTVSSGSTLDLNGYTGTFGGNMAGTGTWINKEGNINITGTTTNTIALTNLTNFHVGSGATHTFGANISATNYTIDGTLNLTGSGFNMIFEDKHGAGMDASSGTFNMIGDAGNFVSIMSATEPSPTYTPTINASLMSSVPTCTYVNVYTVDSTGATIVCRGTNISAVGSWDFASPRLTLWSPNSDNSSNIEAGSNMTINFTATDDTNLAYMFFNITNTSTPGDTMLTQEISVYGNSSYTWASTAVADWGVGQYTLEISASDDHNEPKYQKTKDNVERLWAQIDTEQAGALKDKQKLEKIESTTMAMGAGDASLTFNFVGRTKTDAKHTVEYKNYQFKTTHEFKLGTSAEQMVFMKGTNLEYHPDSRYRGHFIWGKRQEYFYDWDDVPESVGIKVVGKDGGYYVTLSNKDWKSGHWVKIDPTAGGVNIQTEFYQFTITDTLPPEWFQTPTDQTHEFYSPFTYQVNATDNYVMENIYIDDTTNFRITLLPADVQNRSALIENITAISMGSHALTITANDTGGRTTATPITITVQDTTPPTWNQTPTDQFYEYNTSFTYQVNATDTGFRTVTYSLNETTYYTIDSATGVITNVGQPSIRTYWINITATDPSNNKLSQVITVNPIDTTSPVWNPTPSDQTYDAHTGTFSYTIHADDADGVTYAINDTTNFKINASTGLIENNTVLTESAYFLYMNATDPSGNPTTATIRIDYEKLLQWNQTITDWQTMSVDRGQILTVYINASGNAAITYSDNETEIITGSTTGIVTYHPNYDFIGNKYVMFTATNDSGVTTINNSVKIVVNYVDYYTKPGNQTGIDDLFTYSNEVTQNWFGRWILIALFIVLFMSMKFFPTEHALTAAATLTTVASYILYLGDWVDLHTTVILTVIMLVGVITLVVRPR